MTWVPARYGLDGSLGAARVGTWWSGLWADREERLRNRDGGAIGWQVRHQSPYRVTAAPLEQDPHIGVRVYVDTRSLAAALEAGATRVRFK